MYKSSAQENCGDCQTKVICSSILYNDKSLQECFLTLVNCYLYSSHKSALFAKNLQRHNLSIPLVVKTRWNCQHHTICKVPEISHKLLIDHLRNIDHADLVLTVRDITILQKFASIFVLFAEATGRTQCEKSVSIALVAPSILSIYFDLKHEQSNCRYLGSLCIALLNSLRERFGGLLERCEEYDQGDETFNV